MINEKDKEGFSVSKRVQSFGHAGRGIYVLLRNTHSAWVHVVVFIIAIVLGILFRISGLEWVAIALASGLVFALEAANTAIELSLDLVSPEYHPRARDSKDVSAGAVLIAAFAALAVGLIIFIPKVIVLWS